MDIKPTWSPLTCLALWKYWQFSLSLYLWFICEYSSPEALNKTWPCSASTKRSINRHSDCFRLTTYLALWINHTVLTGHAWMALNFMGEMQTKIENSSGLLLLLSLALCITFCFFLYLSSSFCGNEMLSQLSTSLLNTVIHYKYYQSQYFPLGKEKVTGKTDTGNASPSVHTCVIVAYFHSVSQPYLYIFIYICKQVAFVYIILLWKYTYYFIHKQNT